MSKVILYLCLLSLTVDSYYCWMTDINTTMLIQSLSESNGIGPSYGDVHEYQAIARRLTIIFPGTKWCGPGNIADNYDDLGSQRDTDMCCRAHDNCPDYMSGGETKNGLTNTAFYTRLNCDCDSQFLDCLKGVQTTTSKLIGIIYFDILNTKCYREDYPIDKCVKKEGLFDTKCVEYSFDTDGDKVYQWFDVPDF